MQESYFLDKTRVRQSFDRAAGAYDAAAILQTRVREEMLQRLQLVKLQPAWILDAGCGTGLAGAALAKTYPHSQVLNLDLAPGMVRHTLKNQPWLQRLFSSRQHGVCGDIEQLPIRQQSVDLLWSNLSIQWCNQLDSAFAEMRRVLKPQGLLMFSTLGPDTLKELRAASSDDGHTHVSQFIDMHDIGDALVRAGFSDPVLDVERYTLTYDDVLDLMRDLKAIGAHNAAAGRRKGLAGRAFIDHIRQRYENYRQQGKLPATYEVVFGHAWCPDTPAPRQDGLATVQFHPKSKR